MKKIIAVFLTFALALMPVSVFASEPTTAPKEETIIRSDEKGLVDVIIEDGKASIEFNLDKWNELFDLDEPIAYDYYMPDDKQISGGPFPIIADGEVVDAAIGNITDMDSDYSNDFDSSKPFVMPTVILLMADGSLCYTDADIFLCSSNNELNTFYTLAWIEGAESLSFETISRRTGETTIYAYDTDGLKQDVRISHEFQSLVDSVWTGPLLSDMDGEVIYWGKLYLDDDTNCRFEISHYQTSDAIAGYKGSYRVVTASEGDKDGNEPYSIVFELGEFWSSNAGLETLPETLNSVYFTAVSSYNWLYLTFDKGDKLFQFNDRAYEGYSFEYIFSESVVDDDEIFNYGDPEIMDYLAGVWKGFNYDGEEVTWTVNEDLTYELEFTDYTLNGAIELISSVGVFDWDMLRVYLYEEEGNTGIYDDYGFTQETIDRGRIIMSLERQTDVEGYIFDSLFDNYFKIFFIKDAYGSEVSGSFWGYDEDTGTIWLDPIEYGFYSLEYYNITLGTHPFILSPDFASLELGDAHLGDPCTLYLDEDGHVTDYSGPKG